MSSGLVPVNRKGLRNDIVQSLALSVPSAQAVYGYLKSGFEGDSPVVRMMSAGSQRQEVGEAQGYESQLFFDLQILVLLYEEGADADAVAELASDQLDQVEFEIFQWFSDHQQVQDDDGMPKWVVAKWENRSTVVPYAVGTHFYLVETIPIIVEVAG